MRRPERSRRRERGTGPTPGGSKHTDSVVHAANDEHSKKPETFYEIIESCYYDVPKLAPPEQIGSPTAAEQNTGKAAVRAVTIEAILTFLLVFVVFGSAVDPRHPNVGGFAIGLTVAADILIGGPLTGAAMNPARVVGTAFPMLLAGGPLLAQQWVYWVGPLLGGALAGLVYQHAILEPKSAAAPAD